MLLDDELVAMLGEGDRRESARRVDAYLIEARGAVTYDAYAHAAAAGEGALASFFKRAHQLGLVVGASVKSDLGLGNRRTASGELHLDRCPLVFFALPRVNERAGAMSDMLVRVNVRPRFSVSDSGRIRYLGPQPSKAAANTTTAGRRTLSSVTEVRCAEPRPLERSCAQTPSGCRGGARQGEPRDYQEQDGCRGVARGTAPQHGRVHHAGGR